MYAKKKMGVLFCQKGFLTDFWILKNRGPEVAADLGYA
jgi:hypothetical protein